MNTNTPDEDQLELYLDRMMSPEDEAIFKKSIDPHELQHAMELQSNIDDSLKRLVLQLKVDEQAIERQFLNANGFGNSTSIKGSSATKESSLGRWIGLAVAASLMLGLGLGLWFTESKIVNPVDLPRQVAMIYQEKVDAGFQPYYFCEDPERFARNFENKLGQALALSEMPADRRMVGISYLGGVSRKTVAMLSEVQNEKVIVFVDKEGSPGIKKALESTSDDVNVFVERKYGLVFVEVTPLDSAGMIGHFELAQ